MFKFEIQLISTELLCYLHGETYRFSNSCLSVCLYIRLSVCPSQMVSLNNSKTLRYFFLKLDTNVEHHQAMCREQGP